MSCDCDILTFKQVYNLKPVGLRQFTESPTDFFINFIKSAILVPTQKLIYLKTNEIIIKVEGC